MSTTISEVEQVMNEVLVRVAERSARNRGFVQRRSKLSGAVFAQTLVLGWLHNPQASLEGLTQTAAALGVKVSPQALDQRFGPEASAHLKDVLDAAVSHMVSSDAVSIPVFERFSAVVLQDSSTVRLPDELEQIWEGLGGTNAHGASAIKLHVRLELKEGGLEGPLLSDGRVHDQSEAVQWQELEPGGLKLADLGYFKLSRFSELDRAGSYYISRYKIGTRLFHKNGTDLELSELLKDRWEVELAVLMGATHRLKVRLIGVRVSAKVASRRRRQLKEWARKHMQQPSKARLDLCDWTLLVTNVPSEMLSLEEALVLSRTRWQIELLFKLWKQHGQIDEWRSAKPYRILCELYAKLVAMVIQHWILLVSCWKYPDRSLVKAAQTVRDYGPMLACAMRGIIAISLVLEQIGDGIVLQHIEQAHV